MWREGDGLVRKQGGMTGSAQFALLAGLLLGGGISAPRPALAQDWFTAEACTLGEIRIWRDILSEADEARLETIAREIPNSTGRLWKITSEGGRVSHLWGTYHVPDRAILDLPQAFRDVLEAADVVALEFDPVPAGPDELRRSYDQQWMWRPGDEPYDMREDFPPDYLDYIGRRISTYGWNPDYLPMMTDAGVFSLLLGDPCSDYLAGFVPGQDYFIAQTGWLAGAKVVGLQESWALGEELTAPHRAEQARAAALLYGLYLGPGSVEAGLRETSYALYLSGRLGVLDAWSDGWPQEVLGETRGREVVALTESYLLVERNAIWMERIRGLADEGGAVIAVGASHLPGDQGLVTMLRDAGYRVERVVLPGERG